MSDKDFPGLAMLPQVDPDAVLIDNLRNRIRALTAEVGRLTDEIEEWETEARALSAFVGRLRGGDRPAPGEVLAHWGRSRVLIDGKEKARG